MSNTTTKQPEGAAKAKPTYRVWLVQDRGDGQRPDWTDLTGLWPLKTGKPGFTGFVDRPVAIRDGKLMGRIVVLPPKDDPKG